MGETFGFVGLVAVVGCFTILLLRLLRTARFLPDDEESLVVVGIFAWATAHVVINIASMDGADSLTGITLPLLSYGGTSMLLVATALGVGVAVVVLYGEGAAEGSGGTGEGATGKRSAAAGWGNWSDSGRSD